MIESQAFAPLREVRQPLRNIILAADIKHALSVRQYAIKQRRKAPQRMRTEQQIDLRIALLIFSTFFPAAPCSRTAR